MQKMSDSFFGGNGFPVFVSEDEQLELLNSSNKKEETEPVKTNTFSHFSKTVQEVKEKEKKHWYFA